MTAHGPSFTDETDPVATPELEELGGRVTDEVQRATEAEGHLGERLADVEEGKADATDPRLDDARAPTAHKTSHATGGTDAISPADIGAATAAQGATAGAAAASVAAETARAGGIESGLRTDVDAAASLVESASQQIADHLADTIAAHAASAVSFTPGGTIAATDAQTAIAEVATDAQAYADSLLDAANAMQLKGGISAAANPNYPAADAGHTYKITAAGKIGGASGTNVEIGDTIICTVDSSAAGTQAAVGANWLILQTNLEVDPDGTLAANSDGRIATQKAVRTYIAAAITALGLGTAATHATGDFATAAQGATADAAIPKATVTTKGDAIVATGSGAVTRLPAGPHGQILAVDVDAAGSLAYSPHVIPRRRPCATRGSGYGGVSGTNANGLSDGVSIGGTAFHKVDAARSATGVFLRYGNFYADSGGQHAGPNNITVACALQNVAYPSTIGLPGFVSGRRSAVIEPGAYVDFGPFHVPILGGASLGIQTNVLVAPGEKFPRNVQTFSSRSEGHTYATACTLTSGSPDVTGVTGVGTLPAGTPVSGVGIPAGSVVLASPAPTSTTFTLSNNATASGATKINVDLTTVYAIPTGASSHAYGPMGLYAEYGDPTKTRRCGLILLDSIAYGYTDTSATPGPFARALDPAGIPYVQGGIGGLRADQFIVANVDNHAWLAADGCTDAFVLAGTNDINQGIAAATVQASLAKIYLWCANRGLKVHAATLPPITASSDGQTVSTAKNTEKAAVNAWIRGGPANVTDVIELGDALENTRDGGKFKSGYCSDALHPNATGYAAAAAVVPPALLTAMAA